jgi:hypothetical protein
MNEEWKTDCIHYKSGVSEMSPYAGQGHDYRFWRTCYVGNGLWEEVHPNRNITSCPVDCKYWRPK